MQNLSPKEFMESPTQIESKANSESISTDSEAFTESSPTDSQTHTKSKEILNNAQRQNLSNYRIYKSPHRFTNT